MARKMYPYSLDRHDAKIAGVCSTLGAKWGIDPTFLRIAWIAIPVLTPVGFTTALILYAAVGFYVAIQKRRDHSGGTGYCPTTSACVQRPGLSTLEESSERRAVPR